MKKLFVISLLSFSLLASASLNANAAETTVEYSVDGSYTVKIPEYLEAENDSKTLEITDAVIPFGQELTISANYDGTLCLEDEPSVTLPYKLFVNENEYINGTVFLKQNAGNPDGKVAAQLSAEVNEKPLYAGVYHSTVTFDIQVREVTETDYATEDIEKNLHLIGIGSTKPEYVVARFNEDFSAVIITKNGENSDGKMKGWNARTSPFCEHKDSLMEVTVKKGVVDIGSTAFYECSNISDVHLPDGITEISSYAFNGCSSLQSVYLSNDIKKINTYAFAGCSALTQITLPKDLDKIEDGVFSNCSGLTSVTIGDKVTKIGSSSFSSCGSLKVVELPPNLQSIGFWAFRYCNSLETVELPESALSLGSHAFSDCRKLRQIRLPEKLTEFPDSLVYNCSALEHIDIPNGVTKIGNWGLSGCRKLSSLYIPNSVITLGRLSLNNLTSLTAFTVEESHPALFVEDGVLYSKDKTKLLYFPCAKNISRYTVPESVTELGESCFGLCSTLTDIYVGNQVTVIDSGMFGNMKKPLVHTPAGSAMEQFCAANNIPYDNVMQ